MTPRFVAYDYLESPARREIAEDLLREALAALEPLSRLELPSRPQGNAVAYSIRHDDIRRARTVADKIRKGLGDDR